MSRYRKIDVRMYGDKKFKELSAPEPNAQTLWIFLLTGPHTGIIPGVSHIGEAGLAESLGWDMEAFREAFREVSGKSMAKADWKARLIWIPKAILYNKPESPNVVISWGKYWDEIPECSLKSLIYQDIKGFMQGYGEGFLKAFGKSFGKTMPNQEQEQEQEQDSSLATPKATGASNDEKKPRKEPTGEHAEIVRFFSNSWKAKYQSKYPFSKGKDGNHIKSILAYCEKDTDKAKNIIRRFFEDSDRLVVENRHTLGQLVFHLAKYVAGKAVDPDSWDGMFNSPKPPITKAMILIAQPNCPPEELAKYPD